MVNPELIADKKTMERFFRDHLDLFPRAKELVNLSIQRNDPEFIFDLTAVVVEYQLALKTDKGTETVKLRSSSDTENKRFQHYNILKYLSTNGFDKGHNRVAEPLGYFKEFNMLLYRDIAGQSLYDKMQYKKEEEWIQKIWDSVNWLIEFYKKNPRKIAGLDLDPKQESKKVERLYKKLLVKYHGEKPLLTRVYDKIKKEENRLNQKHFTIIHGDFQADNIIFTDFPSLTYVIDFNELFFYDELYDIAYFTAQTSLMSQRIAGKQIDRLMQQTIDHYLDKRKINLTESVMTKIKMFQAKTLMHILIVLNHDQTEIILDKLRTYAT